MLAITGLEKSSLAHWTSKVRFFLLVDLRDEPTLRI